MRCESSSWNVTDTLRTVTTITSNWKGMSRMIWFTSSITRWMRIDGTEYWKEFFFISVPFQWNSREFLLKKWEKENIPFAQSHNTVRDARLKHSWNPMMKMSVFWFWNMLLSMIGIFEAPPMSCPVFLSNHYFSLLKKWCIFLFMLFHTQNLGYFSWSCCEVRMWVQKFFFDM